MSQSGKVILRFHRWVRKLVITEPKVQSSSILSMVDVMRLMGIGSLMDPLAALKMSLFFRLSLTRLCCGIRNMCGMNWAIQDGSGTTKLLCSSLFMVFITTSSFFVIDGLLPCCQ